MSTSKSNSINTKTLIIGSLFASTITFGQNEIIPVGGEASGTGGSSSFTIGQVTCQTNSDADFSLSEGVQQPIEISVLSGEEKENINLVVAAYPNPTNGRLILSMNTIEAESSYILFDLSGREIIKNSISNFTTIIDINNYPNGTYLLEFHANNSPAKTFKIIKN
ncbi:MAG: T9SS type A sorting domain-containing protein [Flavobacteriales bacterium]|nr:T9SS type A sorting domain-containing protein [Flavobacteriales bacterium]